MTFAVHALRPEAWWIIFRRVLGSGLECPVSATYASRHSPNRFEFNILCKLGQQLPVATKGQLKIMPDVKTTLRERLPNAKLRWQPDNLEPTCAYTGRGS